MYVCVCSGVTESKIIELIHKFPIHTVQDLCEHIDICINCEQCREHIMKIIRENQTC